MELHLTLSESELPLILTFIQENFMPVELDRIVAIEDDVAQVQTDLAALTARVDAIPAVPPGLVEDVAALETQVNDLSTALGSRPVTPTPPPAPTPVRAARR